MSGDTPQRLLPTRWSAFVVALAVIYCTLFFMGLAWTGWFRVV